MRDRELHPKDPRNNPEHRERGRRGFTYDWTQIAALLVCSEKRAQNMAALRLFDPTDVVSVHVFANVRAAKKDPRR